LIGPAADEARKMPGRLKWGDITLKRGYTSSQSEPAGEKGQKWFDLQEPGPGPQPAIDAFLKIGDVPGEADSSPPGQGGGDRVGTEGDPQTANWNFDKAWPSKVSGPTPKSDPSRGIGPGDEVGFNPQPEPPAEGTSHKVRPGEDVGFNPQPEPPVDGMSHKVRPGDEVGFNPQPEPPAEGMGHKVKPGDEVGFNPQPEPPAEGMGHKVRPGEDVGFNPQPEPPAEGMGHKVRPGEDVGFNPQPEPPGEPSGGGANEIQMEDLAGEELSSDQGTSLQDNLSEGDLGGPEAPA
jgi:hypothetical protein